MTYQITAPHFCAGLDTQNDKRSDPLVDPTCIAPIIRYMGTWSLAEVERYCFAKGWKLERVA